jgi:hypothetical protein
LLAVSSSGCCAFALDVTAASRKRAGAPPRVIACHKNLYARSSDWVVASAETSPHHHHKTQHPPFVATQV